MFKGPEVTKTLGPSQNSQWEHSMDAKKKGTVSEFGGRVKARAGGTDEAVRNMVRTPELIPRPLGSHWKVVSKQERETDNLIYQS